MVIVANCYFGLMGYFKNIIRFLDFGRIKVYNEMKIVGILEDNVI